MTENLVQWNFRQFYISLAQVILTSRIGRNYCEGRIVMNNVCFAYPSRPNIDVLKSMSLVFEPQQSTALVGPSGGGKSTIMDLLDRWMEPSQGNIYLDGSNVQELDMKWYRSQIRVVEQVISKS